MPTPQNVHDVDPILVAKLPDGQTEHESVPGAR